MRKLYSFLVLLALVLVIAACSSDTGDNGDTNSGSDNNEANTNESDSTADSSDGGEEGVVEIFSWWTGAGEEDGLLALIDLFTEQHPEITVENAAVAGGAGTNAKAVLTTRMQGNDPPSTFQVHGGEELNQSWVIADKMEPLNDLYEENDWMDKFPQDLIDLVSHEGDIYSVPVNIHRGNVMFYNMEIFEEHNLEIPTTIDEFFEVAETLEAAGIVPLALGDKESWTATQIFENVLAAELGVDGYAQLFSGEIDFEDDRVVAAAEKFGKILDYINEDHASRNWQDSAQLVAEGEAAMTNMGDWAKGYFSNDLDLETNVDFGYFPFPGTEGSFAVITDTFGLPKGVDNPEQVKTFLTFLGTPEAQDVFNPLKGSIPARVDADMDKYDDYGKDAMADFQKDDLFPSLAHGSAASEGFLTKANQAVNIFVTQRDVDNLISALQNAAPEM